MKKSRTIVLTGGGSGGHLTPLLSVAESLHSLAPDVKLIYIGQKGDSLGDIMKESALFDHVYTVHAGKFRRYHGEGFKQLLDVKTGVKNLRDGFLVVLGLIESWRLLGKIRPSLVFSRGGFVSVPVCWGGALRGIPYVTHDSDAIPSLANRMIARAARLHAVALPKELYPYPQAKTVTVGVPIQKQFKPVTPDMQAAARAQLDLPSKAKVLFVIGGGLGARRINTAVVQNAKKLFSLVPGLVILHVAGRGEEADVRAAYESALGESERAQVRVFGFTSDVARMSAAADLVITRAGATNMAEFAQQGKACIIIPNPQLTGGHQLKNASVYYKADAAVVLLEADMNAQLTKEVSTLMGDAVRRATIGQNLHQFALPKAAESLAQLLLTMLEGR